MIGSISMKTLGSYNNKQNHCLPQQKISLTKTKNFKNHLKTNKNLPKKTNKNNQLKSRILIQ